MFVAVDESEGALIAVLVSLCSLFLLACRRPWNIKPQTETREHSSSVLSPTLYKDTRKYQFTLYAHGKHKVNHSAHPQADPSPIRHNPPLSDSPSGGVVEGSRRARLPGAGALPLSAGRVPPVHPGKIRRVCIQLAAKRLGRGPPPPRVRTLAMRLGAFQGSQG